MTICFVAVNVPCCHLDIRIAMLSEYPDVIAIRISECHCHLNIHISGCHCYLNIRMTLSSCCLYIEIALLSKYPNDIVILLSEYPDVTAILLSGCHCHPAIRMSVKVKPEWLGFQPELTIFEKPRFCNFQSIRRRSKSFPRLNLGEISHTNAF